jgi:hypothetical protein
MYSIVPVIGSWSMRTMGPAASGHFLVPISGRRTVKLAWFTPGVVAHGGPTSGPASDIPASPIDPLDASAPLLPPLAVPLDPDPLLPLLLLLDPLAVPVFPDDPLLPVAPELDPEELPPLVVPGGVVPFPDVQ